jgi:hypothetical protein
MKVWNDKVLKKYLKENKDERVFVLLDKFKVHEQFVEEQKNNENVKFWILPSGFTPYL